MSCKIYPNLTRIVVLALFITTLAGCSYFAPPLPETTTVDIINSVDGKPLQFHQQLFPVNAPAGDINLNLLSEVPARPIRPMRYMREPQARIQNLGTRLWLVVDMPVSQLVPLLQKFLEQKALLPASNADLSDNKLRSTWQKIAKSSTEQRFHFFIEGGLQPSTTEVHVTLEQRNKAGEVKENDSVVLRREIAKQLGQYLLKHINYAVESLAALELIDQDPKMLVSRSPYGVTSVALRLDYKRSWASVGKALKDSGYKVIEEDNQQGTYLITDATAKEKRSWFNAIGLGNSPYEGALRVSVKGDNSNVKVTVETVDKNGELNSAEKKVQAEKALARIIEYLS